MRQQGFTLIEMSIVLVIIGLIVGGVLVGQNLIAAAGVRATISQIEKYNSAVNTFRTKYNNQLPGDIDAADAAQFGFFARGTLPGQGDGNGILEGYESGAGTHSGLDEAAGETVMFWVDLSTAGLIEGGFNTATVATNPTTIPATALGSYFPAGKLGRGNYVYVFSGGYTASDGINYFGLAAVYTVDFGRQLESNDGVSVSEASAIDTKIDDGLPMSGNVMAQFLRGAAVRWTITSGAAGPPYTTATQGYSGSCYDNGNVGGATQQYSLTQKGGSGVNCALSFRFQ